MWKRLSAAVVMTASLQAPAPPARTTLTLVRRGTEPLFFSNPMVKLKGTIRPIQGNRLDLVVITVGDTPIDTEIRQFALIAADGSAFEPIAAGGGPDLIFPIDSLELGREMGQILPSDAEIMMSRTSTTSVTLEADPGATLAFVFQLPEKTTTRALRLPGGRELALPP
jgi:hypothetical protein